MTATGRQQDTTVGETGGGTQPLRGQKLTRAIMHVRYDGQQRHCRRELSTDLIARQIQGPAVSV